MGGGQRGLPQQPGLVVDPRPVEGGPVGRVEAVSLDEEELSVVDVGDPEPTDITVARNGRVYWTCTSAGVVSSDRGAAAPAPGALYTIRATVAVLP